MGAATGQNVTSRKRTEKTINGPILSFVGNERKKLRRGKDVFWSPPYSSSGIDVGEGGVSTDNLPPYELKQEKIPVGGELRLSAPTFPTEVPCTHTLFMFLDAIATDISIKHGDSGLDAWRSLGRKVTRSRTFNGRPKAFSCQPTVGRRVEVNTLSRQERKSRSTKSQPKRVRGRKTRGKQKKKKKLLP